jgi:hypothetical protein
VVTLWGVFGELATVGLLFREIEKAGGLSTVLVVLSWILLGAIVFVAVVYTLKRMRLILEQSPAARREDLLAPETAWPLL